MSDTVHLLVVAPDREPMASVRAHLARSGHGAVPADDGRSVLAAARSGGPLHAVFIPFQLPDMDAISLVRELRRAPSAAAVAICTPFAELSPAAYHEAERLGGVTFIDLPVDPRRIDQVLHALRPAGSSATSEQPFFGTAPGARHGESTRYFASTAGGAAAADAARGSDQVNRAPGSPPTGTARIRRSVTGTFRATAQPPATPAAEVNSRSITCAACAQVFVVPRRTVAFSAFCVHCGKPQRVDPG